MKLYVKKIWTYNPNKYKFVSLEKALAWYQTYLDNLITCVSYYQKNQLGKTFDQWLKTEI